MEFSLSKSQKEIQKAAWEFARGLFDKEAIIDLSKTQTLPGNVLEKAADLGFTGIHYPENLSGGGLGLFEQVLVAETFCRKDSTLGFALIFSGYAAECVLRYGGPMLQKKFLPKIAEGGLTSTGAFREPGQSRDLTQIFTIAEPDGDGWVLTGRKTSVPRADTAGLCIVLCRTDPAAEAPGAGMSLMAVEAGSPGLVIDKVHQNLGCRMLPLCDITLDKVRVPGDHLIGGPGRGYAITHAFFTENRIQIAGLALGVAQGAFDRALAYVKEREQFGKKLARFQITRHKLAEMAAAIEAARYLTYCAAWSFDQGKADPHLAAMAKLTASRAAMHVADEAVQLLGGYGYMTEYEVEHFFRDAKFAEIFQGPPEAQKDVIADGLIGKLK